MPRIRKRFAQRSTQTQYTCFINPASGFCPHCQLVAHTYETHLPLLRKIIGRMLQDSESVDDYLHEFYHQKLVKKSHKFKVNDPNFNARQYMARMLRNFVYDERGRRIRHRIIEAFVVGLTRNQEDLVMRDLVSSQVFDRFELEFIFDTLKAHEASLIKRLLEPDWDIHLEASRDDVQPSAIRARVNRIRSKLRKAVA